MVCSWFLFLVTVDGVNLTKGSNTACNPVFPRLPDKDLFSFDFAHIWCKKPGWKPNVEDEVGWVANCVNLQMHVTTIVTILNVSIHYWRLSVPEWMPGKINMHPPFALFAPFHQHEHCANLSPSSLVDINWATVFPFFGLKISLSRSSWSS